MNSLLTAAIEAIMVGVNEQGISVMIVFIDGTTYEKIVDWEIFLFLMESLEHGIEKQSKIK